MVARPIMAWPPAWCGDVESGGFFLQSNSLVSSGINPGAAAIYGPRAQVFTLDMSVRPLKRREWQKIDAFFARLGGVSGKVRINDPKRPRPGRDQALALTMEPWSDGTFFDDGTGWMDGFLPPYVTVYEAAPAGSPSVVVTGLPASTSACLWAGDLIEYRPNGEAAAYGMAHLIANDAPTDASGRTRLELAPSLRKGVAAGDMVVLQRPTSVFRLVRDDMGVLSHMGGGDARVGFSLLEVLPE